MYTHGFARQRSHRLTRPLRLLVPNWKASAWRDLGAASAELAGVIAVAVVLVGTLILAATPIGTQIACTVESAITGQQACQSLPPLTVDTSPSTQGKGASKLTADQTKVSEAQKKIHESLSHWVTSKGDLEDIERTLADLNGAEIDATIAALSDDDLGKWVAEMKETSQLPMVGGWDQRRRQQMWSRILADASPQTVRRIAQFTKDIQPAFYDVKEDKASGRKPGIGPAYEEAPQGAQPVIDGVSPDDISQGYLGDCWYIASLQAVAQANPSIIEKAIKDNGNGTYTVTLHKDGNPVYITVTTDQVMPHDEEGKPEDHQVFARNSNPREMWPVIMEKALASYEGSYGATEGGFTRNGLEIITGQNSSTAPSKDVTMTDLNQALQDNKAVTVETKNKPKKFFVFDYPDNEYPDPLYRPDAEKRIAQRLYYNHAYSVRSVNLGKAGDPSDDTVTVVNPWGGHKSVITMPFEDFKNSFGDLTTNPAK